MEYWIIVDKHHAGPYSASQLVDAGLQPDTLVWREGLTEWIPAGQIEELATMMQSRDRAIAEIREHTVEVNAGTEAATPTVPECPQPEPEQPATVAAPPQPQATYARPSADERPPAAAYIDPGEPCPPAYIAWSIIATLLCCTIIGIPAIIFSSMTKSAYYRGDIAKAKRYSELAQWFIILAITLGVVCWPFQLAFMGSF